ncbi:MAG: hypothetical protein U0J65_07775 [Christensenellales bacterium]|nr:hypothetical protein [Christensenellales bacterium]
MFHAPFRLPDCHFNLPQHLARDHADRVAKLMGSCRGVEVQHLGEVLPVQLRLQSAAQLKAIGDAGCGGLPEGRSDVEFIILRKEGIRNAVEDVPPVVAPIRECLLVGNLIDLLGEGHRCICTKILFQHFPDGLLRLLGQSPRLDISRPAARAGVRHIKDIAHTHPIRTGCQQRDALGAAPDVPVHGVVPEIIPGTGRCIRALGIDQQLIAEGVLVQSG